MFQFNFIYNAYSKLLIFILVIFIIYLLLLKNFKLKTNLISLNELFFVSFCIRIFYWNWNYLKIRNNYKEVDKKLIFLLKMNFNQNTFLCERPLYFSKYSFMIMQDYSQSPIFHTWFPQILFSRVSYRT